MAPHQVAHSYLALTLIQIRHPHTLDVLPKTINPKSGHAAGRGGRTDPLQHSPFPLYQKDTLTRNPPTETTTLGSHHSLHDFHQEPHTPHRTGQEVRGQKGHLSNSQTPGHATASLTA